MAQKVAITGAAGLLGTVLSRELGDRYTIVGIDRARTRRRDIRRANTARSRRLHAYFRGVDAVVDLAGIADAQASWRDVWRNNLPATMNALDAARRANVRRFVFASSNHVTGMYEQQLPYAAIVAGRYGDLDPSATPLITAGHPIRPDGPYAVGKALGEAAGRYYSDRFGLSVVCLRIGTVNAQNRPLEPREFATLLTHADLVRLVEGALAAPDELRFGLYYGVSRNRWRFWDIAPARDDIGYEPQDDAERFRGGD